MRRSLLGWLALVMVLSAVAIWVPQRATKVVEAVKSAQSPPVELATPRDGISKPLPFALEPVNVRLAQRDPFAASAVQIAAAPLKVQVATPVPAAAVSPVEATSAVTPAVGWRCMGTMTAPDGGRLVLLTQASGKDMVVAAPGAVLDGGYEIVAVVADAVRLYHQATRAEVVIAIPPAQEPAR
jgi:hypothetical protein